MLKVYWKRVRVALGLLAVVTGWNNAKADAASRRDGERVRIIREHKPRASGPTCRERFNANDCSAIRGCDWIRTSNGVERCARVTY